jgi:hypothetical protein
MAIENLEEAKKYIVVFSNETTSVELKVVLSNMLKLI